MPFSSRAFTRLASLKRGGGWVKCWSVSSFFRESTSPSARGGSWVAASSAAWSSPAGASGCGGGLLLDLLFLLLLVDGEEALELQGRALGAELVGRGRGFGAGGAAEMSTTVSS